MIFSAILPPTITSHLLPTIILNVFILKPAPASTVQISAQRVTECRSPDQMAGNEVSE